MEKAYCLLAKQMLIATGNFHGGGSPEEAVAQTWTFDSPLWAFFGYFLSQQKVTESLPQKRLKPRKKSSLLLKSRKTHPQFHPIFRQQPTKNPQPLAFAAQVSYNEEDARNTSIFAAFGKKAKELLPL